MAKEIGKFSTDKIFDSNSNFEALKHQSPQLMLGGLHNNNFLSTTLNLQQLTKDILQ